MNKQEYNNVIETTVAQQIGEKDSLETTREVLNNMGVVLPQGDLKQVSEGLATDDYMGWRKCTVKEAQEYANEGTAVVAVSDEQIALVAANDDDGEGEVAATSAAVMTLDENTSALAVADMAFYANSRAGTTQYSSSRYGQVMYQGKLYDIFVPDHLGQYITAIWNTVDTYSVSDWDFSLVKFLVGFEIPDPDKTGLYAVGEFDNHTSNVVIQEGLTGTISAACCLTGLLNAFSASVSSKTITFYFQETSDGRRRVIITAGSSEAKQLFDQYATGVIQSMYYNRTGLAQAALNTSVQNLYKQLTGEDAPLGTYDCQITIDEKHKTDNGAVSYLWLNAYGELMETSIIYPKDKVEFGRLKWLFSLEPFAKANLSCSYVASDEYQEMFYNDDGYIVW